MPKQSNVTPIRQEDPTLARALAYASACALHMTASKLEGAKASASKDWSKARAEAEKAHRERLTGVPDDLDLDKSKRAKLKRYAELGLAAVRTLAALDAVKAKAEKDLSRRAAQIAKVCAARSECLSIAGPGEQLDLLGGAGSVDGMGWASKATLDAVYSALRLLHRDGALDDVQGGLLAQMDEVPNLEPFIDLSEAQATESDADEEDVPDSVGPAPF